MTPVKNCEAETSPVPSVCLFALPGDEVEMSSTACVEVPRHSDDGEFLSRRVLLTTPVDVRLVSAITILRIRLN